MNKLEIFSINREDIKIIKNKEKVFKDFEKEFENFLSFIFENKNLFNKNFNCFI